MTARRLALACWGVTVLVTPPAAVLLVLDPDHPLPNDLFGGIGGLGFLAIGLTFATVGAVVATRLPGNRIGWVFCLIGLASAVQMLAYGYARHGLNGTPDPGADIAAWVALGEATAGAFGLALLLFPDGRLPSDRWRPAAAASLASIGLLLVSGALRPGPLGDPFANLTNPFGVTGAEGLINVLGGVGWTLAGASIVCGAAALLVRRRRATGVERQQLKLVLAVGSAVALATALVMARWAVWPEGNLRLRMAIIGLSFSLFPLAAGVAITRYRLYDIDVVINRALVYAALTLSLGAAYLASVLLLQLALESLTTDSQLAVAGSTLAVAALFRPLRSRIQAVVDSRFYRSRFDARRTLEAFSSSLRDQVELEPLSGELRQVVHETMHPAHVSLWLREPSR